MQAFRRTLPIVTHCALAGACSPTSPRETGYAGRWPGTTAQGRPIEFTISASEMVTSVTVGHEFAGCSGSETFTNLSLAIAPEVIYRAFNYASGNRVDGPSTDIRALFLSAARAEGTVSLRGFPGCGSAIAVGWNASRR